MAGIANAETAATPGVAETSESRGIADIIVTAQKRTENLQNVPIAVTAISGNVLAERGVADVQALSSLVPNVTFSDKNGEARITLRGLGFDNLFGSSAEPRTAYHVDGAYISQSADIGGTFYDIERVEVNRGPQGTLFGRNAVAGTVNLVTRSPTEHLSGYLNGEVGNYDMRNIDGAISGPLGDGVSGRIAFQTRDHSGYDYNVPNKVDINNLSTQAVRAKIKFSQSANFTATLSADYFRENDRAGGILLGFYNAGTVPPAIGAGGTISDGNPRHDFSNNLPATKRDALGFTLDANLNLGNGYSIASISSYRRSTFYYAVDIDMSNLPLISALNWIKADDYSQELRLNKDFRRGNLTVGAYFFGQSYESSARDPIDSLLFSSGYSGTIGGVFSLGGHTNATAFAGFGQFTYELTDTTKLIAGGRYSWERKSKSGEYAYVDAYAPNTWSSNPRALTKAPPVLLNGSVTFHKFSPRVTLEQKLGANQLIYATFAQGFKTGGWNLGQAQPKYDPESLTDYEIGFKIDAMDRKLRLNGAAFYYKYTDMQVSVTQAFSSMIVNAARARIYGAELEMTARPVAGLQLDASAALLKTEFTNYDTENPGINNSPLFHLADNRLPSAPTYTLNYGAQYTFDTNIGKITIRGEGRSTSNIYFDSFNQTSNMERAVTMLNTSLRWVDNSDKLSATLFVRNITNVLAKNGTFVYASFVGYPLAGDYDPPRTFGLRLGVNF
jgi:iron complex outermembrane receptor protein